jgi:hypothetical protein
MVPAPVPVREWECESAAEGLCFADERRLEPGLDDVERRGDNCAAYAAGNVEASTVSRGLEDGS